MKEKYEDFDHYFEDDIDVKNIKHLYQMRHACNVLGYDIVARELKIEKKIITTLFHSGVHGSKELGQFFNLPEEKFRELLKGYQKEERERQRSIEEVRQKNENLVQDLKKKRELFAGLGTNKAKRRLNKLAISFPLAKAIRLALEIEDKSIQAKNSYGDYQDRIYRVKEKLISDLSQLFLEQDWVYGVQRSEVPGVTHVVYFEIPSCEQLSWHFSPATEMKFPDYAGDWDGKENSTLSKLEKIARKLLEEHQLV